MATGPVDPAPAVHPPVDHGPTSLRAGGDRRRLALVAGVAVVVLVVSAGVAAKLLRDGDATPSGALAASPSASASASVPVELPTVLAHRGGQESAPLQTLAAITDAADAGYGVETDVRWTEDDVAVLIHEERADEDLPCDPEHAVGSTFYNVLLADCHARDQAGRRYPVATLRQAAAAVAKAPAAQLFAEIKEEQGDARAREYLAVLVEAGIADRSVATSFTLDELTRVGDLAEAEGVPLRRMLFLQKGSSESASDLRDAGLFAVALTPALATTKYVAQLHAAGLKVVVWTVNRPREWQQAKDVGADTVLTDRPDAYLKWL